MVTCDNPATFALDDAVGFKGRSWSRYAPSVVVAASFVPVLVLFAAEVGSRPHYRFLPLVIPGAAALAWRHTRGIGPFEPTSGAGGWGAAALAWLLLAAGVAFITPWFAAVGAIVAALGAAYALGGRRLVRAALPGWVFLWVAIPPPRKYDFMLIAKLQSLASGWSSEMLDWLGVIHFMDGNVLTLPGKELLVDDACSGIYSLFTLLIGTLFFTLWSKRPPLHSALLVASSVLWVILGNVARIVGVVILGTRWGIDASSGWKHEWLGLVMFLVMIGMVTCADQLCLFFASVHGTFSGNRARERGKAARLDEATARLEAESRLALARLRRKEGSPTNGHPTVEGVEAPDVGVPGGTAGASTKDPSVSTGRDATWLGSKTAALAFGALLAPQFLWPGMPWRNLFQDGAVFERRFAAMGADAMPERAGPLLRVDFATETRDWDNSWGRHSRSWFYRDASRGAVVSLDYHFIGWHELTDCYTSRGWRLDSVADSVLPAKPDSDASAVADPAGGVPVRLAEFSRPDGLRGRLVFGLFDRRGRPLEPPRPKGTLEVLKDRLGRWGLASETVNQEELVHTYQLQVFVEESKPASEQEMAEIVELFRQARRQVERLGVHPGGAK